MIGDSEGAARVEVSAARIQVTIGANTLISKLIDGTFPDYQRVIPQGNGKIATVNRIDLAKAVDRVSTIASERGKAVKFSFATDRLTVSVQDADGGTAIDELDIAYEGEPLDIGFNARYVGDTLGILDSETVSIAMDQPGSPAICKPTTDGLLTILMPMRVAA